ncbi:MAG: 50S ribosomal protein L3 [bacterium]|nr:MAG: 50S ribosomal protein L3 [bacterium]
MKTLFGTKGQMTQTFIDGSRVPVTKVTLGPCVVTQIKNEKNDGYWAIQLGFGNRKAKNTSKPLQGHLKSKEKNFPRYVREVRMTSEPNYKVGDIINVSDIFKKGDTVSVTAVNKGKGFAGGVRRYNFRGGPKTHGQSDRHRAPGSIGQTTTPGRVYKGKRMAGRMGGVQVTFKNARVVDIDAENNQLLLSSPIPGRVGIFLTVNKIKSGSLDFEHHAVATVVEGESPAGEESKTETAPEAATVLEEAKN